MRLTTKLMMLPKMPLATLTVSPIKVLPYEVMNARMFSAMVCQLRVAHSESMGSKNGNSVLTNCKNDKISAPKPGRALVSLMTVATSCGTTSPVMRLSTANKQSNVSPKAMPRRALVMRCGRRSSIACIGTWTINAMAAPTINGVIRVITPLSHAPICTWFCSPQ